MKAQPKLFHSGGHSAANNFKNPTQDARARTHAEIQSGTNMLLNPRRPEEKLQNFSRAAEKPTRERAKISTNAREQF